jgi:hypothetical protein
VEKFQDLINIMESRFRDKKEYRHFLDLPMFTIYAKPEPGEMVWYELWTAREQVTKAFSDARKRITKMGFPSMHANVSFEKTPNEIGGTAYGHIQSPHGEKKARRMRINYHYLHMIRESPDPWIRHLTDTIVHEWAHLWMFNNSKPFQDAVEQYYEALTMSNIDKVEYDYFLKHPGEIFGNDLLQFLVLKIHRPVQSGQLDDERARQQIAHHLWTRMQDIGPFAALVDFDDLLRLSDEMLQVMKSPAPPIEKNRQIQELDVPNKIGNLIKREAQPRILRLKNVREQLVKLVNFTRQYGLEDSDETWATALEAFETLHPYHRKRIFELMQTNEGRKRPNSTYYKKMKNTGNFQKSIQVN